MPMPPTPPSAPADAAVLLVNLGTPGAPTARAVRRYLAEFLHDHRVVQLSRWLWCPLLHFVILPLRGPRVAEKYASIWLDGPLVLGLEPMQIVLLAITVAVATLTVVPGRAKPIQGVVHLAILATFLFFSLVP